MSTSITTHSLTVDKAFHEFVETQLCADCPLDANQFWAGLSTLIDEYAEQNRTLLAKRKALQTQIDGWHQKNAYDSDNLEPYKKFLRDIGYLVPEGDPFTIDTKNVDPEISSISGPQLVVPVKNARFAINAANARWGSLYDALYGTDAIDQTGDLASGKSYNPARGQIVIERARALLDEAAPLDGASHLEATRYFVENGTLKVERGKHGTVELKNAGQFAGFAGSQANPHSILLRHNGLHLDIQIDPNHPIGKTDLAHVSDVIVESAVTTILDCEDSIAAVDAEDKIEAYQNLLGLFRRTLTTELSKGGKSFTRTLAENRHYTGANGTELTLPGLSMLLVRNVGHLMTTPTVLDKQGREIPEGLLDAMVTGVLALHDLKKKNNAEKISKAGSIYIVKPKMHGPQEVAFANSVFDKVEALVGLPANTMKMGIMDEERRTTVNLMECIRAAKSRVIFINTGFLDRTGDEIHTSMHAGPMVRKNEMKTTAWLSAYEQWNVDIGLACGFKGRAQIGKGMWAMPDLMAAMIEQKIGHPQAGADCAWAPSPTAATLHALHYHKVNVDEVQDSLAARPRANLDDILTIPVAKNSNWSPDEVEQELENNAQGILGYVVRWIDHGVGCSKVPDINNIGLMEDRATLRISSQHIANWLHHDIVNKDQVMAVMKRMAKIVDAQNANDPDYSPMHGSFDTNIAFQAACSLVFQGTVQPSGYTEPILHAQRLVKKAAG